MDRIPLFTRAELSAAFALILPASAAADYAHRWFDQFADDEDAAGRYLWDPEPFRAWATDTEREAAGLAVGPPRQSPDEVGTGGYEVYAGRPDAEKGEFLLRFSDFHLNLVSLVSPELAARVAAGRGDTPAQSARSMRHMRAIVAAMRP